MGDGGPASLRPWALLIYHVHVCICLDGNQPVDPSSILFFATGCRRIPPMSFNPEPTIEFLHDVEKFGTASLFPKANTCSCILYLPTVHKTYEKSVGAVNFAIQNGHGFGFA